MKTILLFIDNKKEQMNFVQYFKATAAALKIATEMSDFRFFMKNQIVDFIILDSSITKYWPELSTMIRNSHIPFMVLKESGNDVQIENSFTKPFSFKQIVGHIEEKLNFKVSYDEEKAEKYLQENQYVSVKIKDIPKSKTISFDLYIKINETKFVKIVRANEPFMWELIENLQKRGASSVHAKRDEYSKYIDSLILSSKNINSINSVTDDLKIKFLNKTSEILMDQIYTEGLSKEDFFDSKQILDNAMDLIVKEEDGSSNLIKNLNEMDASVFRHSLAMSIYSVMIAKHMDFISESTYFKLSTGALFADIGLRGINSEIINKSKEWMTLEELDEYCRHPILSLKLLSRQKDITQDILDIVAQHHENCDGSGYPKKIIKSETHPLSRIVRLAHEFVDLALKTEANPHPDSPQQIITKLILSGKKIFDQECLIALAKLYQIDFKSIYSKVA